MTLTESLLLRRLYETEQQLQERNFAKDHSFEEWLQVVTLEVADCNDV